MKKLILYVLFAFLAVNVSWAQVRGKIKIEPVSPHQLTTSGLDVLTNSVSAGLRITPNQTYVYLSAWNFGNSDTIQTATFTLTSKPSGSATSLTTFGKSWVYFKPDVKGDYTVSLHLVTATGSHDTTQTITASDWVGVGNFEGVAGNFPKCMTCHASDPKFTAIYDKWKVSGHAGVFKYNLDYGTHYSASCMKCHTTGYDHNVAASNNGFDDIAASLGWAYTAPSVVGKWDSLKTMYPGLVNHATIGCEMCHGAGSQHATTANPNNITVSVSDGACIQCHDSPENHNKVAEYQNSLHSGAVWSSSFAQASASQNNSLANCIRCHDGQGFVNFTYGRTTNTTGMTVATHENITCATCHDPHGSGTESSLRSTPAGSDTLANGFSYTGRAGKGDLCINCHKARTTYDKAGAMSSRWGPHHSTQADIFLGQNAATFGTQTYQSSSHSYAVTNACVGCHMVATPAVGDPNRNLVGGHSFKMHSDVTNFDYTSACVTCHGPKNSFSDFVALSDYDGNGKVESIQTEIEGLKTLLRKALPPVGVDSIAYAQVITDNQKKAYWNYQLVDNDKSGGMHNPKYVIDVLSQSIAALGGSVPVQLTAFNATAKGSSVTLTWETATEKNNKGFEIQKKLNGVWNKVGFVAGHGTTSEVSRYSFVDNGANGNSSYRLRQVDNNGTFSYSREVEVSAHSIPNQYSLGQNYPNPFNPSTTLNYSLPFESNVKVIIYNISGEVVKVLVNNRQSAGNYDVKFDSKSVGKEISSGIYFYSLEATSIDGSQNFKQTKKMMLLK